MDHHRESISRGAFLVVIVGWLGCQDRLLGSYKRLYCQLLDSPCLITFIPSPTAIVEVCLGRSAPMDAVVADLVQRIHKQKRCEKIIFHCFSNSGYLLWDHIRRQPLRRPVVGVVFDSCPVADVSLISEALKHCSWQERAEVIRCSGLDYLDASQLVSPLSNVGDHQRDSSSSTMATATLPVEVYLYSQFDPLAPSVFVEEFVERRRKRLGAMATVYSYAFERSPHCDHWRWYPDAYERSIAQMISAATNPRSSKL